MKAVSDFSCASIVIHHERNSMIHITILLLIPRQLINNLILTYDRLHGVDGRERHTSDTMQVDVLSGQ